jgi:hypothetical protein
VKLTQAVKLRMLGACALAFYAIHAFVYYTLIAGTPEGALWACHVGCAVVGLGCLARRALPVAIGTLWLVYGGTVWCIDLCMGANLIPTSVFTHVGGLVVAALALRELRWVRGASLAATVALFVLLGVTRLLTPAHANINLVFAVTPGFEQSFPTFGRYFLFLFGTAFAVFVTADVILTLTLSRRSPPA